ncbi:hypothetical protein PZB74_08845 [Porifericola rhodea]|uniref:hypothetical protein n=1 Tax=Porifericola rhodea TaxID=930972 RepID=UPI0026666892|nr:hypothetical protein [Porifericola rhodea]WKN33437.1 hypothetical protein PZB74_08845 [Porifericola rhodea]
MRLLPAPIIYMMLCSLFLFQSCSEDEDTPSRKEMLTGTWAIQQSDLTNYSISVGSIVFNKDNIKSIFSEDQISEYEQILNAAAEDLFPQNSTVTFNEDNTLGFDNGVSDLLEGETWALQSNEQELNVSVDETNVQNIVFSVEELSNEALSLVLTISQEEVESLGDFNFEISGVEIQDFTLEYTFDFTKQ